MHIALLSPAWPLAQHPNGIVTYVHWLRAALLGSGHRVSVFAWQVEPGSKEPNIYQIAVPSPLVKWQKLRDRFAGARSLEKSEGGVLFALALRELHRRDPIDVVEMEESFGWSSDVERLLGVPVVVKLHGPAFLSLVEEELHSSQAQTKIKAEGEALATARAITSPARHTLEATIARFRLNPPIAQHVVNPMPDDPSVPHWTLEGCDRDRMLFVGRFDKRKGGDIVLQAFRHMLRTRPKLKLEFVGPDTGLTTPEGRLVHFEEYAASCLTSEQIALATFHGHMHPTEVAALRLKALVTLTASRWENQSYTALEAMMQGCPVVFMNAGGQGEIVSHGATGLIANNDDPEDLSSQLLRMFDDPIGAARMGARAREYVTSAHSPAKVAQDTLDVYSRLLACG